MAGTSGDMLSTAQPDGDGKIAWHIFPGDQTSTLIPYVRVLDLTDLELVGAQTARNTPLRQSSPQRASCPAHE